MLGLTERLHNFVTLPNSFGLACMQIGVEGEWIGAFIARVMERMPVIASWGFAKICSGMICALYNIKRMFLLYTYVPCYVVLLLQATHAFRKSRYSSRHSNTKLQGC